MSEFFRPEDFSTDGSTVSYCTNDDLADRANRLLKERGTVVWGCYDKDIQTLHLAQPCDATHAGTLIGVEPIVRDTAESLLSLVCDWIEEGRISNTKLDDIRERARKLLDQQSTKEKK